MSRGTPSVALEVYLQQQESRSARSSVVPSPRLAPPPQPIQVVANPLPAPPRSQPPMPAHPPAPATPSVADALEQYDLLLAECAAQLADDGLLSPADVPARLRAVLLADAPSPPLPHSFTLAVQQPPSDAGRPDAHSRSATAVLAQRLQQEAAQPQPDASPMTAEPPPEEESAEYASRISCQESHEAAQCVPMAEADAEAPSMPTPDAKHVRAANAVLRGRLRMLVPANVNAPKDTE